MTPEELLKQRYEVIAEYPGSEFKIGTILVPIKNATSPWYHSDENSMIAGLLLSDLENYPHLFRKMNWWENRTAEEMPQKLMSLTDGEVYEIEEWDMDILLGWVDKKSRSCCSLRTFLPEYGYVPFLPGYGYTPTA